MINSQPQLDMEHTTAAMKSRKITYILLHFPYLTETFVAEEMYAIQEKGVNVQIVSLLQPGSGPIQSVSHSLLPNCWYAPGLASLQLWRSQVVVFMRSPILYLKLLWTLLSQPYPHEALFLFAKRVLIFTKAVSTSEYLRDQEIDLLHTHFAWLPGAATWIVARLLGIPFTVTAHAYDIYAKSELLKLVVAEADHVFTISEYNRRVIDEKCNCPQGHVSVLRCGIDYDKVTGAWKKADPSAGDSRVRVMSVGSLNEKKGHEYLIEACALLAERNVSVSCSIFGGGERKGELQDKIDGLGVGEFVRLLGPTPQEEIMVAFAEHDIFALAAVIAKNGDRDGIPVVLMEAGAYGLPLVSTVVSGIPELVQHGRTGLVVPERDAHALADALQQLALDPALRRRLGVTASKTVRDSYNIERNAEQFIDSLDLVLKV